MDLINKSTLKLVFWFFRFLRPYWKKGFYAALCMALSVLLRLPLPLLTMFLIDKVLVHGQLSMLNLVCLGLICVMILQALSNLLQHFLLMVFRERVTLDLQAALFGHIESLSLKFFNSQQTGYLMSRIADASSVQGLTAQTILDFLRETLTFLVGLVLIFYLHWKLALISLIVLPLFILSLIIFGDKLRKLSVESMEKQAIASRDIQESISGIYLIKSFATEKKEFAKIWHSLEQKMNVNVRNGLWGGLAGTVSSMIGSIV